MVVLAFDFPIRQLFYGKNSFTSAGQWTVGHCLDKMLELLQRANFIEVNCVYNFNWFQLGFISCTLLTDCEFLNTPEPRYCVVISCTVGRG